jgi:hypothetical protein
VRNADALIQMSVPESLVQLRVSTYMVYAIWRMQPLGYVVCPVFIHAPIHSCCLIVVLCVFDTAAAGAGAGAGWSITL